MNKKPTRRYHPVRFAIFMAGNLCLALYMLVAILMLHQGRSDFAPHAQIDKEYVNTIIRSGEADALHQALKVTETARAGAYQDYLSMTGILQLAAGVLAVLFLVNTFFLFRMREPLKAAHHEG